MPSAPSEMASVADITFAPFFFEDPFVVCGVEFVTGKTVELPNDHGIKILSGAVAYHPLEVGAAVGSCGQSAVNVCFDDLNVIFLCKRLALAQLTFDRLLALTVRGIPRIDHALHLFTFFRIWLQIYYIRSVALTQAII